MKISEEYGLSLISQRLVILLTWYPSGLPLEIRKGWHCCNDYSPLSVVKSSLLSEWEENGQWSLCRVPQNSVLLPLLFNIHMRLLGKVIYWFQISMLSMPLYILTMGQPDFVKVFFLCVGGCVVSGWGRTCSSSALTRPNDCGYLDIQFWRWSILILTSITFLLLGHMSNLMFFLDLQFLLKGKVASIARKALDRFVCTLIVLRPGLGSRQIDTHTKSSNCNCFHYCFIHSRKQQLISLDCFWKQLNIVRLDWYLDRKWSESLATN